MNKARLRRWSLYALAALAAVFAALFVTFFTVDIGPWVKGEAERRASKYLERPMHIGRVYAKVTPGEFEFHDVVIEGVKPTDTPFLRAKTITVKLPWWTAFSRHLQIESVQMSDWQIVVEAFPGGKHNVPRLTP